MDSRQTGRFKRSVAVALAALFTAAIPATAFAADTDGNSPADDGNHAAAAPAHKGKHGKKHAAHASKDSQKSALPSLDKETKVKSPPANAKAPPSAKGKKSKKTAARAPSSKKKASASKKGDAKAPPRPIAPCFGPAVVIDRGGLESETMSLVTCSGKPLAAAREDLSILARPWSAARPDLPKRSPKRAADVVREGDDVELAPGIRLLDPGLLGRLDAIARKFPGKTISLVSGYRPQSRGSLHQAGRAIDLRVSGVANEELVAFCRTLPDSGAGYYPNSSFVHVDVRNPGTGSVTWIDASAPGEPPRYVSEWPPKVNAAPPIPVAAVATDADHGHAQRAEEDAGHTQSNDGDAGHVQGSESDAGHAQSSESDAGHVHSTEILPAMPVSPNVVAPRRDDQRRTAPTLLPTLDPTTR